MAKDGEVVISTALDNSQLEKQLQDTKKKIVSLEEKLNKAEQERSPILAQLTEMEEKLRQAAEEAKRFGEQWSSGELGADRLQMEAQARLAALERENDALLEKAAEYDDIIAQTTQELEQQETAAGQLTKELAQAAAQSSRMGEAVDAAGDSQNGLRIWHGRFLFLPLSAASCAPCGIGWAEGGRPIMRPARPLQNSGGRCSPWASP